MKTKRAIVIGAGVGGLSIAARLLANGYLVEVFDKNPSVGGKTNFLKYKNFTFDLTASLLMFPDEYIDIFNYCNKNYKDYFTLIPINPLYKVFYTDGSEYSFFVDTPRLTSTLKKISDNNFNDMAGFYNFISSNYEKYLLSEESFLNSALLKKHHIIKQFNLIREAKINPGESCYEDAIKFMKNKKLTEYLLFQSLYVGVSPYISSNLYNLIPATTTLCGLYHINGGMYSYIEALEKLVLELGGIIHTTSLVDEILFNRNTAIGIKSKGESFLSDIVICSGDFSTCTNSLINDSKLKKYIKSPLDYEHSCSVFILYLALDKKYPNLNIHNIYINDNFEENIDLTFNGNLPTSPSLYIYCPSCIDDTMCPIGYETLNITVRMPNLINSKIQWNDDFITSLSDKIISYLSNINGLEDIREHIVYKNTLTPYDLESKFNTFAGAAFGLSHTLKQSISLRPQYKIEKLKNLYFTGASIHPGTGVAMVLKSSKICANMIIKNN